VQPEYDDVMPHVRDVVRVILKMLKVNYFDLAVTFVTARGMRELNKMHRNVDGPTDVLSFPMETPANEGVPVEFGEIADLGEIVISLPYAHCMAALRVPHISVNDADHVSKAVDSILGVDINPDEDALEDVDIPFEDMDRLAPPLRYIWRNPASTKKKVTGRFRVHSNDLDKIRTCSEIDLNSIDVIFEKDGMTKVRPLRTAAPDVYFALMREAEAVSESTSAHYNHVDNFELQGLALSSPVSMSPEGQDVTPVPSKALLSQVSVNALEDEVAVLLVHGILHLCGYDHHHTEVRDRMQAKTDAIMKKLYTKGLISRRALLSSRYYVLDAMDAAQVAAEFGPEAVLSSTGQVFDPTAISFVKEGTSLADMEKQFQEESKGLGKLAPEGSYDLSDLETGADPQGEDEEYYGEDGEGEVDLEDLARHIESNDRLRKVLLDAGVDILNAEGRVCAEKLREVDWDTVSELPVDDEDMEGFGVSDDVSAREMGVVEKEDVSDHEGAR
jgi:ssRNA-specific RNase YbeY (16S rRNA maturation enzyme)